jgi:hypothetical protein
MPFVKFHLSDITSDESRDAICAATQAALVRPLGRPGHALFEIFHRHGAAELKSDPHGRAASGASMCCTSRC